jgi:DNA-binding response OmpR family regulator
VEDDPDTRDLYETALGLSGLWVANAGDPRDALEYAADLRPDSIVMDVGLPTAADGLALAKAFREDARMAETPVVAVTGLDPEQIHPAAQLFSSVFYKPVSLQQLVRRIKWLSAKSAVLRSRGEKARARVPELVARSSELREKSARLEAHLNSLGAGLANSEAARTCPRCRKPLRFSERRTFEGTMFDYYAPCQTGCGLFCFDHARRKMITLVD